MNKPKYNIGDTVYYLYYDGIHASIVLAIRKEEPLIGEAYFAYQGGSSLGSGQWMDERYLFSTPEKIVEFTKKRVERFMPSTGSNEPLETRKNDEPITRYGNGSRLAYHWKKIRALQAYASLSGEPVKLRVGDRVRVVGSKDAPHEWAPLSEYIGLVFSVKRVCRDGCVNLSGAVSTHGVEWDFRPEWLELVKED